MKFISSGIINIVDEEELEITELPIMKWTNEYKEFLEKNESQNNGYINEFFDDGDEHKIKINIFIAEQYIQTLQAGSGGLEQWFKLNSNINLTNWLHLIEIIK